MTAIQSQHSRLGLREAVSPTLVLQVGGLLSAVHPPTAAGLGMRTPDVVGQIDSMLASIDSMTNSASNGVGRYWSSLTTTDSGAAHFAPESSAEEVKILRDSVSRRTRLTRQQIARALGVDRRSLTSWVNGTSVPGDQRLVRLRRLAELVQEIEQTSPGRATEILLSRARGQDLLDLIARDRFELTRNWQSLEASPSIRIVSSPTRSRRGLLSGAVVDAIRQGKLKVPPRAMRVREESEYEQDLDFAGGLFSDELARPRRTRLP